MKKREKGGWEQAGRRKEDKEHDLRGRSTCTRCLGETGRGDKLIGELRATSSPFAPLYDNSHADIFLNQEDIPTCVSEPPLDQESKGYVWQWSNRVLLPRVPHG